MAGRIVDKVQISPKILVVNDNPDNLALARATLEHEGYLVCLAANGEEGLRAFEAEKPDCVLLDARMPPGPDGSVVCARIRSLPGGLETPVVFLTASRDVDTFDRALRAGADDFLTMPISPTELVLRIQAALKLKRMSAELGEHYESVRRQRDDLMRLQLQKERLSAFVVHDLKNPVNSMDLHAQLLLRNPELPARARDSAQRIRDEVRSLMRLVLNLLDISKSEQGELAPRLFDVDLDALVAELLDTHDLKARTAGVTLGRAIDVGVLLADEDLLRRVLENLLDNALRHAPEKSEIRVTAIERENAIEIRVADRGPGILPEMRERIFEQFVQVDAGHRAVSRVGQGLGLTFCKLAIEAHGGSIGVEAAEPGTTFCVSLPRRC